VDAIGNGLEQKLQKFPRCLTICLIHELGDGELTGPVNAYEEMKLTFDRLYFGDIDMKEADGV